MLNVPDRKPGVAPGPTDDALASLPDCQLDPLGFLLVLRREYGDVVRFQVGPQVFHLLSHPTHVRHVLGDNAENYRKSAANEVIKPAVGNGLLTSEGTFWRRQRRLMQPAFHTQRLGAFALTMTDAAEAMLAQWQPYAEGGQPIDVAAEMLRLTLMVVGKTLFSTDITDEADEVGRAITLGLRYTSELGPSTFGATDGAPSRDEQEFRAAIQTLDAVVYRIIEERRRSAQDAGDLLSILMNARDDETGEGMDDLQLRDEVMTLLIAGHETTGSALTWTWYLLSKHPDVARRLHAELDEVLGGRAPTLQDLPRLTYTMMVLQEVMRLYPPAWSLDRDAIADDEIGGCYIPAHSTILLSPYVTHRHPDLWANPEGFDPDRFTKERSDARLPFTYFPFGGGPRLCIGNNFALMEARLVMATVAQRYELELVPGYPVELEPLITLRPHDRVVMRLRPRVPAR